tara:strand:+ start:2476 stop:3531 length:1056 start_codon:yes stop_codon:yes gene_type:complete
MKKISDWKKIILINFLITFFILLIIEGLSASIYYYKHGHPNGRLASEWVIERVSKKIDRLIALKSAKSYPRISDELIINPKSNVEKKLKFYLIKEYEKEFSNLVNFLNVRSIPLVILWIPTSKSKKINNFYENFFQDISEKNNLDFISMKKFINMPSWSIFMEPYNGHLTRYANHLISEELNKLISKNDYRLRKSFKCKDIKGVWSSQTNEIWDVLPEVPYALTTDEYGFRQTSNLNYSKKKPSLLIAGDSFTFGPYLPFYDTYPSILQRKLSNWNIINAGVASFSIRSEANIIKKNLDCINPSLVILQVLDNDLTGTAIAEYNRYNYLDEIRTIPIIEKKYYDQFILNNK